MSTYVGIVDARCPRCGQSVARQSVPGHTAQAVRTLMKEIVAFLRGRYPKTKVTAKLVR